MGKEKHARLLHVITLDIYIKHSTLTRPYRYYVPPMLIETITAECIWAACGRAFATGPWLHVPSREFANFVWYLFCGYGAQASKHCFAACETRVENQGHGDYCLCVELPCFYDIMQQITHPSALKGELTNKLLPGCQCTA